MDAEDITLIQSRFNLKIKR